jgi:hypothetical protein
MLTGKFLSIPLAERQHPAHPSAAGFDMENGCAILVGAATDAGITKVVVHGRI